MTAEEILEVWAAMDPVIERTVEELLEVWAQDRRLDRTPEAALIPDAIRSTGTAYVADPKRVLNEAIEVRGTTISDYRTGTGDEGRGARGDKGASRDGMAADGPPLPTLDVRRSTVW